MNSITNSREVGVAQPSLTDGREDSPAHQYWQANLYGIFTSHVRNLRCFQSEVNRKKISQRRVHRIIGLVDEVGRELWRSILIFAIGVIVFIVFVGIGSHLHAPA